MTQEDKQLLLQDLCARLPYGLKVHYKTAGWEDKNYTLSPQVIDNFLISRDVVVKPYLRSMSSMTEDEKNEHFGRTMTIDIVQTSKEVIDWLNIHHFDYRGLIPMDLAIEVTKGNNPYI